MGVFLKCALHFLNFIIMLTGLALLALGILAQLGYMDTTITNFSIEHIPIYFMVVGNIIIMISIIGCCGGLRENTVVLVVYSLFMTILMACSVLVAVIIFLKKNYLFNSLKLNISANFHRNVEMLSEIEEQYLCCGPLGAISYQNKGLDLPNRCCVAPPCSFDKDSYPGCLDKAQTFVMNIYWIIAGIAIGLAVAQLLQAVVSSCLAYSIRKNEDKVQYR